MPFPPRRTAQLLCAGGCVIHALRFRTLRDAITVQLVGAKGPSGNVDAVFYVEKRGTYVLERVEEWPPVPGTTKKRFLLILRAYPSR
jgi:hypothetical protein